MTNKILIYLILFLFSIATSAQSPWVNKKGSLYGQYSFTYLAYNNIINDEVNKIVPTEFGSRDLTSNLYADYSITDNLAVLVSLPYKAVEHNGERLSSLGDPTLKVKYQILDDIPLSAYLGYIAPLSKREGVLRTGYNQHGAELGLSIGKGKKKSFIYGGFGYRYRANIPNQVLIEFEYGYRFQIAKQPFYAIFHLDGSINTSSIEDSEAGQANLFHNNAEFISPALKFSYNVYNNFWVNLAAHSAIFVRNYGAASTFTVGLAYKVEK